MTPAASALHFPQRSPSRPLPAHEIARRKAIHRAGSHPDVLYRLADHYGCEIARGRMEYSDGIISLGVIALAHWQVGPDRFDAVMEQVERRLGKAIDSDAIAAECDIRDGIKALLDRRAPVAEIQAHAYRIATARILRPECDAIVRAQIQSRLQVPAYA